MVIAIERWHAGFHAESIKKLLASWVQQRVEHNLSVVSIGAFFMYAASDALSQCVSEVGLAERMPCATLMSGNDSVAGAAAAAAVAAR